MTAAPSSPSRFATLVLPLPIPPVSAMTGAMASQTLQIILEQLLAPEQRDHAAQNEVRAERNRHIATVTREYHQRNADDRAHHGRQQDNNRQHFPAEPRADRREQLEVA